MGCDRGSGSRNGNEAGSCRPAAPAAALSEILGDRIEANGKAKRQAGAIGPDRSYEDIPNEDLYP